MKISRNWLENYIKVDDISSDELSNILTDTGLEVEGLHTFQSIPGGLEGLVVGKVVDCQKHPNADKLSITQVDVGNEEINTIICGAPNVATGQTVIVALPGTTIYPLEGDPFTIKKAKIRGEVSEGMICAEDEIGIGSSHDGIIVIEDEVKPGTLAVELFEIENDTVIEIGLTPNRGDATSHIGVARDLKAVLEKPVIWPSVEKFAVDIPGKPLEVEVRNFEGCPRYSGVVIKDLNVEESPEWLKNRLKALGLSPINNIVDITNFVLHETGQPLHAFDIDKIEGGKIIVDTMPEGTEFESLDGVVRKLKADDLMIQNQNNGMCIAGVFGGVKSGVTDSTTGIFLESAYFSMDYIRKSSLNHGLKTDAAFRYERGIDPERTVYAMKRAAILMCEIAGGTIASDIYDIYPKPIEPVRVEVKYAHITRLIGKEIPKEEIHKILNSLDIITESGQENQFVAVVPAYRSDVTREADVIEEILRIYGLNNVELPQHISASYLAEFPEKDPRYWEQKISQTLVGKGYYEIVTNSLTKESYAESVKELETEENVVILNKLSEDLGVLRQSLLFSGLEVIRFNANRKQTDLKLFEIGKSYKKSNEGYTEHKYISIFLSGHTIPADWRGLTHKADFFDLKSVISDIISLVTDNNLETRKSGYSIFKGGASIMANNKVLVELGAVKEQILKDLEIKQPVFYAEIDWELLLSLANDNIEYNEIPKYPEVFRDLSLVIDKSISFSEIESLAKKYESRLVKAITLFDVYEGDRIENDKKAYAISFTLQDSNKTLTDKEIDKAMRKLMNAFEKELGAHIRQ